MAPHTQSNSRFVIVDAHSHALRAYHALAPMSAPDGLPTNAIFGLAGLLHRLVFEDRPDYLAIVFDAPDDSRTTFRSALYPAYKAHRSARPADLTAQMAPLRDLARAFGLTPLEHPSYEADDLVAALVRIAEGGGLDTTILSADKDLMQLVSERTTLWDSMRGRRYTPVSVKEKLGVPPSAVADYLALVGDSSDNVPGVPGIGPKSAAKLLETFGDLDGIYAALGALSPRERARLEGSRELAFLSRTLTRLSADAPLPCPLEGFAHRLPPTAPLAAMFERLGFRAFPLPSVEQGRGAQGGHPAPPLQRVVAEAPTPTPTPTLALEPSPTLALEPAPTPAPPPARTPPRRLRPTPSELARLFAELDPALAQTAELVVSSDGDHVQLTLPDLVLEVPLRAREPAHQAARKGSRPTPQAGLFDAPTPLSGPELAALITRHLGAIAAHLPLCRGEQREPAVTALMRWGHA